MKKSASFLLTLSRFDRSGGCVVSMASFIEEEIIQECDINANNYKRNGR